MKRPAFTLVETLVVVSVVALLLGVLLPTLSGAIGAARSAACASNLRQLQLANLMHAKDRDGRFAAGAPNPLQDLVRWHGARATLSSPFAPEGGTLTRYLESAPTSDALRECPSFARTQDALRESSEGFDNGAGGYAYNNAFVGVQRHRTSSGAWIVASSASGASQDRFRNPSRTLAFADGAFAADDGLIEYAFLEPRFWPDIPGARTDPTTHFRHAERANVVWLDGHLSSEVMTFTWSSGFWLTDSGSVGLGWFGDRDDNSLYDYE